MVKLNFRMASRSPGRTSKTVSVSLFGAPGNKWAAIAHTTGSVSVCYYAKASCRLRPWD